MNNPRTHYIEDWPQLAHQVGYSVSALAKSCNVSVRSLERLCLTAFGHTPRRWLNALRMRRVIELLRDGSNVNQTADCLGYHDRSHFSREFKKHYRSSPKRYANPPAKAPGTPKMSHSATELSRLATKM